jgi:hypothetical protein
MIRCPSVRVRQVFLQSSVCVIDPTVQNQFASTFSQLLGRHLTQQRNRIVVKLPPSYRVNVAEQLTALWMPTPPKVVCQRPKFAVQIIRMMLIVIGLQQR